MPARKNIQEELEKLAPQLAQLPVREPFVVPDGYFARFPEVMAARIRTLHAATADDEKELLSPLLSGLPKKMPFSLPDQYFEQLPDKVVKGAPVIPIIPKIPTVPEAPQRSKGGRVIYLPRRAALRIAAVAAAAIVLIVAGVWMFRSEPSAPGPGLVVTAGDSNSNNNGNGTGNGNSTGNSYGPDSAPAANRQDLLGYMQYVSDSELIQYAEPGSLAPGGAVDAPGSPPAFSADEEDLSLLLAGISDQELEHYLEISDI